MFIKSLTIKNYKCFESEAVTGFNVPDGRRGSGLNVLIGENGTGKTTLLEAINFLTSSKYTVENRLAIHDFADIAEPIEVSYEASTKFRCDMPPPYRESHFDSSGIRFTAKSRKQRTTGQLLSSPFAINQRYRASSPNYKKADGQDSGNPIEEYHTLTDRASIHDGSLSIFYFDKNRSRQLTRGTYKTTFERICDDLNWRFVKALNKDPEKRTALEGAVDGDYFDLAKETAQGGVGETVAGDLAKFLSDEGYADLRVDLVNYLHPFSDARLTVRQPDSLKQVLARDLGSGIEIVISLLMLRNVASASKGSVIYLIDEPEAHLHPKAQESVLSLLMDEAKEKQVFVSTHSPYMFKAALADAPGLFLFVRRDGGIDVDDANQVGRSLFPWGPTWGEINYRAYDLPTIELHNELYGYVQERTGNYKEASVETYLTAKGFMKAKRWTRLEGGVPQPAYAVTLPTYVRHRIHHPENTHNAEHTDTELRQSIEGLVQLVESGL